MKYIHLLIITVFIFSIGETFAQKKRLYLFENFHQGTVIMRNNKKTSALLNYDTANHMMMFKDKEQIMILTNTQTIDTIYIDSRKFIPAGRIFLELRSTTNGEIYINWTLKTIYKGKTGAYGQVSQASHSETINTNWYNNQNYEKQSTDIYSIKNDNEYWLLRNNKYIKFNDKKSLLKLFPNKKESIDTYMKGQKTDIKNPEQVILLADYCLGL